MIISFNLTFIAGILISFIKENAAQMSKKYEINLVEMSDFGEKEREKRTWLSYASSAVLFCKI